MKVVLNSQSENYTVYGFIVPSHYTVWAELILNQMLVPNVSFLGHLGGILAGLLYLRLKNTFLGPDPLAVLIRDLSRGLIGIVSWPVRVVKGMFLKQRRRISGRGRFGQGSKSGQRIAESLGVWRCPACTYDNNGLLSMCVMCGTGRTRYGLDSHISPSRHSGDHPPVDELRRRRIERFGI